MSFSSLFLQIFNYSDLIQMTETIEGEKLFSFLVLVIPATSLSYFFLIVELQSPARIVWACSWFKRKIQIEKLLPFMPVVLGHH